MSLDSSKILLSFSFLRYFCWLPSHINIRGNERADLEAKSALSLSITNLKSPYSDFKSNVYQYIINKCQSIGKKKQLKINYMN